MEQYPLFHDVSLQLAAPPATSLRALDEAAQRRQPADESSLYFINQARAWAEGMLAATYRPPVEAPFLTFPMESGLCDVVRTAYQAQHWRLQIGVARHLICIKVLGVEQRVEEAAAVHAQGVAEALFRLGPQRLSFTELGTASLGTYGRQNFDVIKPLNPQWPDWLEVITWWTQQDVVGFLTTKQPGGPVQEVISAGRDDNLRWFPNP